MEDVMKEIKECNGIRYPFYRTAAKVLILHRKLYMQFVPLQLVIGVFERHKLSITENSVILDETEVEDVIADIYFAARKEANVEFDINKITKLAVACIFSTFNNKGKASVFSVKVLLTLISCGSLHEKYEYFYQLLADHNACLSKAALNTLLTSICKVTELLGESVEYGSHLVQSNVDSCFVESQGCLGVSKTELRLWLMQDPPLLTWISTFNRLKLAEHVVHNVKCSSCKITPIRGPRFTCLRCARYHQCQMCFFFAKTSHKHKLKHPVKEYCTKILSKQNTKPIVDLIRNKLRLCPIQVSAQLESSALNALPFNKDESLFSDSTLDSSLSNSIVSDKVNNDPQKELSSIINHLEQENRKLQVELKEICGSRDERLQQHREAIEAQLQRLKTLKKYMFHGQRSSFPQTMRCVQSTPLLPSLPVTSRFSTLPEFQLSPIIRTSNNVDCNNTTISNGNVNPYEINSNLFDNSQHDGSHEETREVSSSYENSKLSSKIQLSTWIGGNRTSIYQDHGNFSKWLSSSNANLPSSKYSSKSLNVTDKMSHDDSLLDSARDNTPSSLQRPDKHSRHSSLQNIQGDLNDILNRLQNMVANDCLLEESFNSNDNCELKRAATQMEDLLTDLIQGIESRKGKLATVV
ncbi:dystrophin-like isoform X2 [Microplitis mediator]|uniref:dystrophin-like isoform X2 n=1 Tax=Microplitis mediator TaxID=375433 RepID=UPI002552A9B5|nr:dystrophin-like isoform X2 [Microplitis mediator]